MLASLFLLSLPPSFRGAHCPLLQICRLLIQLSYACASLQSFHESPQYCCHWHSTPVAFFVDILTAPRCYRATAYCAQYFFSGFRTTKKWHDSLARSYRILKHRYSDSGHNRVSIMLLNSYISTITYNKHLHLHITVVMLHCCSLFVLLISSYVLK